MKRILLISTLALGTTPALAADCNDLMVEVAALEAALDRWQDAVDLSAEIAFDRQGGTDHLNKALIAEEKIMPLYDEMIRAMYGICAAEAKSG